MRRGGASVSEHRSGRTWVFAVNSGLHRPTVTKSIFVPSDNETISSARLLPTSPAAALVTDAPGGVRAKNTPRSMSADPGQDVIVAPGTRPDRTIVRSESTASLARAADLVLLSFRIPYSVSWPHRQRTGAGRHGKASGVNKALTPGAPRYRCPHRPIRFIRKALDRRRGDRARDSAQASQVCRHRYRARLSMPSEPREMR